MLSMFSGGWLLVYTDFIATYWFGWIVFYALLRGRIFCKTKVTWTEVLFWDLKKKKTFRKISIYVWTRPETHVSRQEHDSLKHISTRACRGLRTHTRRHTPQEKGNMNSNTALPRLTLGFHSDSWLKENFAFMLTFAPELHTEREPAQIPSGLDVKSDTTSENIQHPICFGDGAPIFLVCFDKWLCMYVRRGLRERNAILE